MGESTRQCTRGLTYRRPSNINEGHQQYRTDKRLQQISNSQKVCSRQFTKPIWSSLAGVNSVNDTACPARSTNSCWVVNRLSDPSKSFPRSLMLVCWGGNTYIYIYIFRVQQRGDRPFRIHTRPCTQDSVRLPRNWCSAYRRRSRCRRSVAAGRPGRRCSQRSVRLTQPTFRIWLKVFFPENGVLFMGLQGGDADWSVGGGFLRLLAKIHIGRQSCSVQNKRVKWRQPPAIKGGRTYVTRTVWLRRLNCKYYYLAPSFK